MNNQFRSQEELRKNDQSQEISSKPLLVRHRPDLRHFYEARRLLNDETSNTEHHKKTIAKTLTWDDKEDQQLANRQRRAKRRLTLIQRIAPDMKCMKCGSFIGGELRRWTVVLNLIAVCKSCWHEHMYPTYRSFAKELGGVGDLKKTRKWKDEIRKFINIVKERIEMRKAEKNGTKKIVKETIPSTELFGKIVRFTVNHQLLAGLRMKYDISAKEFAVRMGWSQAYQSKLESGQILSVDRDTMLKIGETLESFGIVLAIED